MLAPILSGPIRLLAVPLAVFALHSAPKPLPFHGSVQRLSPTLRTELVKNHLWHRGCPVGLSSLRLLTVSYRGFDGQTHDGDLVVNATVATSLVNVFRRLYRLRFQIHEMQPIHTSGDDTASFECRDAASSPCPGTPPTHHWSMHAFGEAVDVNPTENPYTGCGRTRDRGSIPYLNRSRHRRGMVTPAVVATFASIGWGWGGSWSGTKDYMHFSSTGH